MVETTEDKKTRTATPIRECRLSVEWWARRSGLGARTIWRYLNDPRSGLKGTRVGRRVIISEEAWQEWFSSLPTTESRGGAA